MALNVLMGGQTILAQSHREVLMTIEKIIDDLGPDAAQISVADDLLIVTVNKATGYGALIWFVPGDSHRKGGVYDHMWISDNPNPPQSDPRIFADLDSATYHDRRSAIPLSDIRKALKEYFNTDTGDRPESISWVKGRMDGERIG